MATHPPPSHSRWSDVWWACACAAVLALLWLATGPIDAALLRLRATTPSAIAPVSIRADWRAGWFSCLEGQRACFLSIVRPLLNNSERVVLVDLPQHWNLGDSFLWLGELNMMGALGLQQPPATPVCTINSCNLDLLGAAVGSGTILLHGGGNFGDLYPAHNQLRSTIVRRFPNNTIVLMPQSVVYRDERLAAADAAVFASHRSLTLLARTAESLEKLGTHFNATPRALSPDAAFMLGPVLPDCEPTVDIAFLLRSDIERRMEEHNKTDAVLQSLQARNVTYTVDDWLGWQQYAHVTHETLDQALASLKLHVANRILCRGRVVVSDRMHAMILALLMGRPFVGFDNNNRKLSSYRATHLDPQPLCRPEHTRSFLTSGIEEAVAKALQLLDAGV